MADLANSRVDLAPREHGLLDIARDSQRRRALAVDRAVDRIGKAIVGVNRPFDLVEAGGDLPDDVADPVDILGDVARRAARLARSEEHTSELQSLMRISYAVFCLKKKTNTAKKHTSHVQDHD